MRNGVRMGCEFFSHGIWYPKVGKLGFQEFEAANRGQVRDRRSITNREHIRGLELSLAPCNDAVFRAVSEESRELMPGDSGQFRGLPKRQDALGIERDAKLSPQTRFHLRLWKQQAASDGFRYVKVQRH